MKVGEGWFVFGHVAGCKGRKGRKYGGPNEYCHVKPAFRYFSVTSWRPASNSRLNSALLSWGRLLVMEIRSRSPDHTFLDHCGAISSPHIATSVESSYPGGIWLMDVASLLRISVKTLSVLKHFLRSSADF